MELGIARYDIDHLSNAGPVPGGYDTIDMMRKSYRNNSHPGKKKKSDGKAADIIESALGRKEKRYIERERGPGRCSEVPGATRMHLPNPGV